MVMARPRESWNQPNTARNVSIVMLYSGAWRLRPFQISCKMIFDRLASTANSRHRSEAKHLGLLGNQVENGNLALHGPV